MEEKVNCPECGKPFGSNPDCGYCSLKRFRELAEKGPKKITQKDAEEVVKKFGRWKKGRGRNAPDWLYHKIELMQKLVNDYLRKRYQNISWRKIAGVVFVLHYVMNPFDLLPDYIPVIGWIDDMTIVSLLVYLFEEELSEYQKWLNQKTKTKRR